MEQIDLPINDDDESTIPQPRSPRTPPIFPSPGLPERNYHVFDPSGKLLLDTTDIFEAMKVLKEQAPKSKMKRDDGVLLAYTTNQKKDELEISKSMYHNFAWKAKMPTG